MDTEERLTILDGYEVDILENFWGRMNTETEFCGWNIHGFDLPFLVRRSWILGARVPAWLRNGRYWDQVFIDLMAQYALGTRDLISLNTAAKALSVGRKNGDGAEFAKLYNGTAEEREKAVEYLRNDLVLTVRIAERIGVTKKGGAS
jgi:predicted PolB exonuclease-like 3'-5' exonuclease